MINFGSVKNCGPRTEQEMKKFIYSIVRSADELMINEETNEFKVFYQ